MNVNWSFLFFQVLFFLTHRCEAAPGLKVLPVNLEHLSEDAFLYLARSLPTSCCITANQFIDSCSWFAVCLQVVLQLWLFCSGASHSFIHSGVQPVSHLSIHSSSQRHCLAGFVFLGLRLVQLAAVAWNKSKNKWDAAPDFFYGGSSSHFILLMSEQRRHLWVHRGELGSLRPLPVVSY